MARKPLEPIQQEYLKFGKSHNPKFMEATQKKLDEHFPPHDGHVIERLLFDGFNEQMRGPIGLPGVEFKLVALIGEQGAGGDSGVDDLVRDGEELRIGKGAICDDIERGLGARHHLLLRIQTGVYVFDEGLGVK